MTSIGKETNLLLTLFALIFFCGFLLANPILICTSFVPLFVYLLGTHIVHPKVQIQKAHLPSSARLSEIIEAKIAGRIAGGPGAVVIYDEVPKPFQLVAGSNYIVISKGFKEKAFSFSYKIRCTKCGIYRLGTGWQTRHILGMTQTQVSMKNLRHLRVVPKLAKIEKIRLPLHMITRTKPDETVARIGSLSTDFKEIRDYFYGDPFKIINWKASARVAGWRKRYPMVNEYEREGKLSIWLFLDADPTLRIGNSIEDTLEYSIRAAYNISHHFLNKGFSLGMYIYNHREETFHFDKGKKQLIKIADSLLKLATAISGLQIFWNEGFSKAVEQNQKFLITKFPRIIVITHITPSNYSDLLDGLMKILAYKRRRRQPNILIINILPYSTIPTVNNWETSAVKMLDISSRSLSNRLRNLGTTVLDWNPMKESVEATLLSTIRLK